MSTFKDMVARDLCSVFHNVDEFAELRRIHYNGEDYGALKVILDETVQKARTKAESDHGLGIFTVDAILFINYEDMRCVPEHGQRIWVDDVEYRIDTSACEMGQIELGLRRNAE